MARNINYSVPARTAGANDIGAAKRGLDVRDG
jgi:hypothetical protein